MLEEERKKSKREPVAKNIDAYLTGLKLFLQKRMGKPSVLRCAKLIEICPTRLAAPGAADITILKQMG